MKRAMNPFVQYLDQYNALSPNHAKIYDEYTESENTFSIETRIERFLLELFENEPRSVVLTGNAGDGKTRLCRMVFESLTGQKLLKWPRNGIVDAPYSKGTIRIVKDLSELKESVIFEELLRLQDQIEGRHHDRVYYLIAANEGKLTKCLSQDPGLKKLSHLVEQRFLDSGSNDVYLHLVNLQDVTSSIYAERILREWNRKGNWEACESCSRANQCVIRLNHRRTVQEQVQARLVEQYRMLDCLGIHVTMREMLIHISYVLTGGLTCQDVLRADYREAEEQAQYAYYNNFYGIHRTEEHSGDLGAIRQFKRLDPGELSISAIDDFLLNGDISGDESTVQKHRDLFDEEIDLLFGYYRKQIEIYRTQNQDSDGEAIFERMPQFRRKFFFESEDDGQNVRRKLMPYVYFYEFIEVLQQQQVRGSIRKDLIQGLNHAFSRKLIRRSETQLFVANENLLIHGSYSAGQVKLYVEPTRTDIDHLPSRFSISVQSEAWLEISLSVFEYLFRLAGGGLFATLRQETEILLNTFKNDLINRSEMDEFTLQLFINKPGEGVYESRLIDL